MDLQASEVNKTLSLINTVLDTIITHIECYNTNHKTKIYTDYYEYVSYLYMNINYHISYLKPSKNIIQVDILECYTSTLSIINSILDSDYELYTELPKGGPAELYFEIYHTLNFLRKDVNDLSIKDKLTKYINNYKKESKNDIGQLNVTKSIQSLFDKDFIITIKDYDHYCNNNDYNSDYDSDCYSDYNDHECEDVIIRVKDYDHYCKILEEFYGNNNDYNSDCDSDYSDRECEGGALLANYLP